jgi:hypothetical protein
MRHICAYKLVATYKMTLIYFLVNIHINNQSTLYKVNGVPISQDSKFQPIPTYNDKDYNTSWCKILKKTIISFYWQLRFRWKKLIGKFVQT